MCVIGQLVFIGTRIVIPSKLWPRTLALAHKNHLGVVGTQQNLRTKVWWPGMDKAVGRHFRACNGCQLVARPYRPPETIRSTPLPQFKSNEFRVNSIVYYIRRLLPTERLRGKIVHY